MPDDYRQFLEKKRVFDMPTGIAEIPPLSPYLNEFQRDIVYWALRRGRSAVFAGTGLGKSLMELSWGQAIHDIMGGNVLILAPLAVSSQMMREAEKFGMMANLCKYQRHVVPGVNVTNYGKLDHFDLSQFTGIVLDESSILKSTDGATKTKLIKECQQIPFRMAATATPAPNDFMELGNHAEFVGAMSYTDMLSTFFTHDGGETQKWRLKGHAEEEFWRWMCSWSVMLRRPSDLGYPDGAYALPPLNVHQHTIAADYAPNFETGFLFPMQAETLQERIKARRATISERVNKAVELTDNDRPWVVWCHLNDESALLTKLIKGAVETKGSDTDHIKESKIIDFIEGRTRVLISKPAVCGHGMNFQFCADTCFVGLNDSFEQVFQAVRRFWRFGQTKPVNVHFIASEIEGAVVSNLKRKEAEADRMADQMVKYMSDMSRDALHSGIIRTSDVYHPSMPVEMPSWI